MASPQNQFTHATTPVTPTGDVLLDSLIGDYKVAGALGTGAVVTYSFPWARTISATWASNPDYTPFNEPAYGFGLSALQQDSFRSALAAWSQVADLQFVEVPDTPTSVGDIRVAWTQLPNPPSEAWTWQSPDFYASAGDIWLSDALMGGQPDADWQAGGFNFMALIHEVGHALWLEHPFEGGAPMPKAYDNNQFTVMSYADHPHNLFVRYHPVIIGTDGSLSVTWDVVPVYPSTPMLLDIAAIQHLYGANMTWHTGDDTYAFDPANPFIMTLWDAGGNDSISASNFQADCLIDLGEGHYSSLRLLADLSLISLAGPPQPNDYDGTDNLAIAWGTMIENAIGGSGNDILTGNALDNRLTGGPGNDTLDAGAGTDTALFLSNFAGAHIRFDAGHQLFVITTALDGTDVVANAELFNFAGQTYTAAQITDITPPTVIAFSPASVGSGVLPSANLTLTFSEPIERGSAVIVLKTAGGAPVAQYDVAISANLSFSGTVLTLNPSADLAYNTAYTLELGAGSVRDWAGNAFAGTNAYSFTTGAVPAAGRVIGGTAAADTLTGASGPDTIRGQGGNDILNGKGGNDFIDGGSGTDTVVLEVSTTDVLAQAGDLVYAPDAILRIGSSLGTADLAGVERVKLNDGLYAFDTLAPVGNTAGGHVWQAAALLRAGFGAMPDQAALSRWAAQADTAANMGVLGQKIIDTYATGITSADLVVYLYRMLIHEAPTAAVLQGLLNQIGPGHVYATQGEFLAYAASLSLNTDLMVGFAGSIQALDASFFG